jgi:lysophospholipase L1-like esterase
VPVPPSARRRARPPFAGPLLALASLGLCAAVIEVSARVVVWRRQRGPHTEHSLLEYDPDLGWRNAPRDRALVFGEGGPVAFLANGQGLRGPERPYSKPPDVTRVLLLGDSFTEGAAVAEPATVAAVLERALTAEGCGRYEVLNGGVSGYSTDQELLFFEKEGARFAPDVVVLLFFSNDLPGNVSGHKKPWFELTDGRLALRNAPVPAPPAGHRHRAPDPPPHLGPWHGSEALRLLGERTEHANPRLHRALAAVSLVPPAADHPPTREWLQSYGPDSDETEHRWEVTLALVDALRASVAAHGASLVVFYVPAGFELRPADWRLTRDRWSLDGPGWDADRVENRLEHACRTRGIPFVDPRPALAQEADAYFHTDPHWTAAGHAAAARSLLPFVRTGGDCRAAAGQALEARR